MIKKFLDLGIQPLANQYLNKPKNLSLKKGQLYKLKVCFNPKTKLVSICGHYVFAEEAFGEIKPDIDSMVQEKIIDRLAGIINEQ